MRRFGVFACAALLVAGCSKPNASGKQRRKSSASRPRSRSRKNKLRVGPRKPLPDLPQRGPLAQKVLYQQAKGLLSAGRAKQAAVLFRRAIEADSGAGLANCYLGLASALGETDDKAGAISAYEKVIQLRPSDAVAHQMFALALQGAGRPGEAIKALERASILAPDQLSTYQDLAGLYLAQKRIPEARGVYRRYETRRKLLVLRLRAPRREAREDAAVALGLARDAATAKALLGALEDKSAAVRIAVIRALGQQGLSLAKAPLEQRLLLTKDRHERKAITWSLAAIAAAPPVAASAPSQQSASKGRRSPASSAPSGSDKPKR